MLYELQYMKKYFNNIHFYTIIVINTIQFKVSSYEHIWNMMGGGRRRVTSDRQKRLGSTAVDIRSLIFVEQTHYFTDTWKKTCMCTPTHRIKLITQTQTQDIAHPLQQPPSWDMSVIKICVCVWENLLSRQRSEQPAPSLPFNEAHMASGWY